MNSTRLLKTLPSVASAVALALALPFSGQSAALSVNGTCVTGGTTCSAPTSISSGQSISGSIPYTLTFADGDTYSISAAYSASYGSNGSAIFVGPTVTYTGAAPSVAADSINLQFYQSYFDNGPGTFDGNYTETIPLVVGANTTASGQLIVDGQALPLEGPFGPGTYNVTATSALTGLTGNTLAYDYSFTFNFGAGAKPGTSDFSPAVPEPVQTIPAALALVGFTVAAIRRRKVTQL